MYVSQARHLVHRDRIPVHDMTTSAAEEKKDEAVIIGPDINGARAPLDRKLYKQILLPNGLRACLVSDTAAMNQIQSEGGMFLDDDDDDESGDEDGKDDSKMAEGEDNDEGGDADSDGGSEDEGEAEAEASWLRDAACAVTVGVGSFADPPDCMGLAHFLGEFLTRLSFSVCVFVCVRVSG